MKRWILFFIGTALCAGVIISFNQRMGDVPPLASLSPYDGFWSAAAESIWSPTQVQKLTVNEIHQPIEIQFDHEHIPHIFAKTDEDLYFAQGYITARDRLWQMDFEARAGLGQLSAIVGPRALPQDQMFVGLRLREAALQSLDLIKQDPITWRILQAYTEGVNAYIHSLKPRAYPLEFKLIGYKPAPWTPLKSIVIAKLLEFQLSGMSSALLMSRTLAKLGPQAMADLFPLYSFDARPIVPGKISLGSVQDIPKPPKKIFLPPDIEHLQALHDFFPDPRAGFGSNSWALSGTRTTSGYPILANDTHLNYSLPGIWYQLQLSGPHLNVFGVSIPGTPGVILGFNHSLAWGLTNGYDEVADWYYIRFKDNKLNEYWYNNQWVPTQKSSVIINVRGQDPVEQTVVRTLQGPVVYNPGMRPLIPDQPVGMAFHWIGYTPSNDLSTFRLLDEASSIGDCEAAIRPFVAPSLNFTCVDKSGAIGLWHAGQIPIKWEGQGRYISDGSDPAYGWHGWIPFANLPHVLNPDSGYILSANENPVDGSYPYYLNGDFPDSFRALRIDEMLRAPRKFTFEDMVQMQSDTQNILARQAVPVFLKAIHRDQLTPNQIKILERLKNWPADFVATSVAATVFNAWWKHFYQTLWRTNLDDPNLFAWPSKSRTLELLLRSPQSKWFQNDQLKDLPTLITQTFVEATDELRAQLGDNVDQWQWSRYLPNSMSHIAHIPGLENHYTMGGSADSIDANYFGHGPVWRMVVEMGPKIQAQAIMPGGESGNPGSYWYNNETEQWSRGELNEVVFLDRPADHRDPRIAWSLEMSK